MPDPGAYAWMLRAWGKSGPDLNEPGVTANLRAFGVESTVANGGQLPAPVGPTHSELVQAAFEGAQRAETE